MSTALWSLLGVAGAVVVLILILRARIGPEDPETHKRYRLVDVLRSRSFKKYGRLFQPSNSRTTK